MRSAIAAACACAAAASRGDELAEPPAPPNEQVQLDFSAARVRAYGSRATSWGFALRHLHWRQPAYEVALVIQWESTRGLRSQSQERGVSFFGAGADLRVPISWGPLTLLPGLRASLGGAQGFGPPQSPQDPYQPFTWVRTGWAGAVAPRLGVRLGGGPVALVVDASYRRAFAFFGVDLSGPSLAAGIEVGSRTLGPSGGSWLVSYTAVYSSFDGNVIEIPVSNRLGVKYLWDRLRLGVDLVGGNSARFIAGVSPGVQLAAFAGNRVLNPFISGNIECGLKLHGDAVMDTVTVPGADAGLEIRPFAGGLLLTVSAGLEWAGRRDSSTTVRSGWDLAGFRFAAGIGWVL